MPTLIPLLTILVQTFFFVSGAYIITRNPRRRLSWAAGGCYFVLAWYYVFMSAARLSEIPGLFRNLERLAWMPVCVAVALWTNTSIEYLAEQQPLGFITKFIRLSLYICGVVLGLVLTFSNVMVDHPNPLRITNDPLSNWMFVSKNAFIFMNLFMIVPMIYASYNFVLTYRNAEKGTEKKRAGIILLGALFAMTGAITTSISCWPGTPFPWLFPWIGELLVLIALFIVIVGMAQHNVFIDEPLIESKDFLTKLLLIIGWITVYSVVLIFLTPIIGVVTTAILIAGLVVTTVMSIDWGYETIFTILSKKKLTLPTITQKEISLVLKNFSKSYELEKSPLISLEVVQRRTKSKDVYSVDLLRDVFRQVIRGMKPKTSTRSRTQKALKYEILRMVANEGASESRILWNLGFESYSKVRSDAQPKFPVRKSSEYKATSVMSYRRLRKEAIDELRWRLVKLEEKRMKM